MITINKINHSFGKDFRLSINNINFEASKTSVLLGKNGSGKSTLIRLLLGIYLADSKDVLPDLTNRDIRSKIGVLLEGNDSLYPRLSVWNNTKYLSKLRIGKFDVAVADSLMKRMGLEKYRNTPIQKLSTGNKRKASLLAIFSADPEYIFLDEPTLGLDIEAIELLKTFLLEVKSSGKTIVITSHDSAFMLDIADKYFLIEEGMIVNTGESKEEFSNALKKIRTPL